MIFFIVTLKERYLQTTNQPNPEWCSDCLSPTVLHVLFIPAQRVAFCRLKASLSLLSPSNTTLLQRAARSSLQLQLAPSLEHQTAAFLSVLRRYKWHQFSVVTSQIAGHGEFIQAVRDAVLRQQSSFK